MGHEIDDKMYRNLDGLLWEIKRQMRQTGGYPNDPILLRERLKDIVKGRVKGSSSNLQMRIDDNRFKFTMNYDLTPDELLEAGGKSHAYTSINSGLRNMSKADDPKGSIELTAVLLGIAGISVEDTEQQLESRGLRSASFEEFLTFTTSLKKKLRSRIRLVCIEKLEGVCQYGHDGYASLLINTGGKGGKQHNRSLSPYPYNSLRYDLHLAVVGIVQE